MSFDMDRARAFGERLVRSYGEGMLTALIDIGDRTGLLEAAAEGPGTSADIADRAGVSQRLALEWLRAMTTGQIIEHDAGTFSLPSEHAVLLTGDSHYNLTPLARVVAATAGQTDRIAQAVVDGEGIDPDEFDDELTDVIDAMSRRRFDEMLVDAYLDKTGELDRLRERGGRIADVGCGAGHAANLMAAALPDTEVVGLDVSERALEAAAAEAQEMGLDNVSFEQADVADIAEGPSYDLVTAFDVVHDLPDPRGALEAIREALNDEGVFLMYENAAPSDLDAQVDLPWASLLYGMSIAHCVQVARAAGGEGVGTMWGRDEARAALGDAGFQDVATHDAPGDPMNLLYVCRG